jgi:peptidoglycan/LPS O-acetylase OafA/YrhL
VGLGEGAAGAESWDEFKKVGMAMGTGVGIYGMGRAGRLSVWLRWGWLQYLGKISYSLFLIHYPVSWAVKRFGYRCTGDQPVAAVCWLVLALLLSLGAADLLYRFVEGPSLRLVHGIKLHQFRGASTAALPVPASKSTGLEG